LLVLDHDSIMMLPRPWPHPFVSSKALCFSSFIIVMFQQP
jgi:hypothetical protein